MNSKIITMFAFAAVIAIKLPYEAGQSFIVTQGYDSPPTHVGKDLYAMDLTQDGCDAFGKLALAASPGTVMLAQESGYNGGYGTQVLVKNASNIVTRYAHMIPGTIPVAVGDTVVQGEPLGEIGNTGLVEGAACPIHPGTHIHFAMYSENSDGSFSPFLAEPISKYVGITEGKWYLSDNAIAITSAPGATAIIERAMATIFGGGEGAGGGGGSAPSAPQDVVLPPSPVAVAPTTIATSPAGGVAASPAGAPSVIPPTPSIQTPAQSSSLTLTDSASSSSTNVAPPPAPSLAITNESFNSTTLAIDLAWQASGMSSDASGTSTTSASGTTYQIFELGGSSSATSTSPLLLLATTTATTFSYPLSITEFAAPPEFEISDGNSSTVETAAIGVPNWGNSIQPVDNNNSNGSWYSDNWYDLGTGFYGLIRSLTLEGFIDNSAYFASHLYLDEYLDANYSQLNQTFTISNNAPFTDGLEKITIGGLDIPLQPNKYYRLRTYQDYQNRSVILAGTTATGTAMWDEFIYGTGRVEHQYAFYPYLAAIMIPNYPPLAAPNAPASLAVSFDSLNSIINFSWPAATDPDTTSSLLTYQWNVSTSTVLNDAGWQSVGKTFQAAAPVMFGNSYTIGIRAVDDLGNVGTPLIEPWNFPPGYAPAPEQLDHSAGLPGGAQKITFVATTTVSGIAFWLAGQYGAYCCSQTFISIHADSGGVGVEIATSTPVTIGVGEYQPPTDAEKVYSFPAPITLPAGAYWFEVDGGPSQTTNGTSIYGSSGDVYSGGEWSTALGQDAYFRIQE